MNILHLGHSSDRVDAHVAQAIQAAGHTIEATADPGSWSEKVLRDAGIPVHPLAFRNRIDGQALAHVQKLLESRRWDIVHAYTNRSLAIARRLLAREKGIGLIAYRGTMGHLSWLDPASWMTYLHPRVDRIVCVSEAVRGYLRGMRIPLRKLTTIYKGHDPAWYAGSRRSMLEEFHFPGNAIIAGFVGNVRPVKGGDILLRAMGMLPPSSNVCLLLIGEIRDRAVKKLASHPDIAHRIRLAGFRKDAPLLSGACDFFVMPSIEREGLPKAVIEAMAQGIPPIVTRVGGMPELVADEESGLIIPPKDAASLTAVMQRMASHHDLRNRLGQAARERIEGPFHISHTIEKTLALYEELVAKISKK